MHLEKQVAQLKKRTAASLHNAISVRRLEKFARLEEEILKYVCSRCEVNLDRVPVMFTFSPILALIEMDIYLRWHMAMMILIPYLSNEAGEKPFVAGAVLGCLRLSRPVLI